MVSSLPPPAIIKSTLTSDESSQSISVSVWRKAFKARNHRKLTFYSLFRNN